MEGHFRVMLRIQRDIETGLRQHQTKQFSLAGLSSIKRMEGYVTIIYGNISRECAGLEDEVKSDLIVSKDSQLR